MIEITGVSKLIGCYDGPGKPLTSRKNNWRTMMLLRKLLRRLLHRYGPPAEPQTSDVEKRAFEREQRAIQRDLDWLKYEVELRRVRRRKR
jgi:hypothetical protein